MVFPPLKDALVEHISNSWMSLHSKRGPCWWRDVPVLYRAAAGSFRFDFPLRTWISSAGVCTLTLELRNPCEPSCALLCPHFLWSVCDRALQPEGGSFIMCNKVHLGHLPSPFQSLSLRGTGRSWPHVTSRYECVCCHVEVTVGEKAITFCTNKSKERAMPVWNNHIEYQNNLSLTFQGCQWTVTLHWRGTTRPVWLPEPVHVVLCRGEWSRF